MIEDVFARRLAGRDPFQIEKFWRESYGSGFTLRPDISLMSVVSGLEMACWEHYRQSGESARLQLARRQRCNERLRSYYLSVSGRG